MKNKRCTVVVDPLTIEQVEELQRDQKNTGTINNRNDDASAFVHAKNGSQLFLRAQGYIDEETGEST